ncbi:hypothetical protein KGS77_29940 [Streptomyces sp. MST-110588]|nr:hypothetical protein KGS77_29940 [Streptomyces sp. MST-110588]
MTAQPALTYDTFIELATADPSVVGLVLKGSRAHDGMPTEHSDHDLYVVLAGDAATELTRFQGHRTPELDLVIVSLDQFRAAGMPGFERYALARVEAAARQAGHGAVLDAWGEDLKLMRPRQV